MKKNFYFLSLLSLLVIGGCSGASSGSSFFSSSNNENNSISINETSSDSSSINSSNSISSNSSLSSSSMNSSSKSSINSSRPSSSRPSSSSKTSSNSSSNSTSDGPTHLGLKTIDEVKQLCKQYVKSLNSANIGIDMTRTVTVRGLAYAKTDLVKKTKNFGLNVSYPAKTFLGDSSGYIACASDNGTGSTLFGKVGEYAGKETSKYEVTGYLSIYLGQPEIYVPDSNFTFNSSLNVNVNYESYVKEELDLSSFYAKVKQVNYNCAGHGYGDIYKVKSIKCIEKRNTSVYIFTDGDQLMKVIKNNTSISIGDTYDIVGYLSTENWAPALQALEVKKVSSITNELTKEDAIEISVADFKKNMASQEDTNQRFDSYMDTYRYVYKSNVYASCYVINTKYYVTIGDRWCNTKDDITNRVTAHTTWNMMDIANDNYWNVTWDQINRYCPIAPYIYENVTFNFYYSAYYLEYSSKKPIWKVFAYNNFLDPIPEA